MYMTWPIQFKKKKKEEKERRARKAPQQVTAVHPRGQRCCLMPTEETIISDRSTPGGPVDFLISLNDLFLRPLEFRAR